MDRRGFGRLTAAALAGVIGGARLAAAEDTPGASKSEKKDPKKPLLLQEPHVCRGLNVCKGKGKGGKNDCAGMGQCATAKANSCHGSNDCAGLGGCGEHPGENSCKGKGECAVPLMKHAWAKARKNFEADMKKGNRKFGEAPKKAQS